MFETNTVGHLKPLLLALIIFLLLPLSGSSTISETATPIKHLIVIMQENHSFDNYFGTYPSANGTLVSEVISQLQRVNGLPNGVCVSYHTDCLSPYPAGTDSTADLAHDRDALENDYNNGMMNGFATYSGPQSMAYFDYHQIPAYWDYAEEYGIAENYFASALTSTNPNRLLALSGTTSVSGNYGPPPYVSYNRTILAQLSSQGISWGYFDFLDHFGQRGDVIPINYIAGLNSGALSQVQDVAVLLQRLSESTNLPSVSFVNAIGSDNLDEHPPSNVTAGELWTVSVVNAVMRSKYWSSSAVFIGYDEGGGYDDHVPPPQILRITHDSNFTLNGYGQRVPFLVISPFAKENYVSKTLLNHMSILRFIDYNWNLPPLNENVSGSNNLLDFFYFAGALRPPIILGNDGPYPLKSFPIPIQIPFSQLAYARTGSWNGEGITQPLPAYLLVIPLVIALIVTLALAKVRRSGRSGSSSL